MNEPNFTAEHGFVYTLCRGLGLEASSEQLAKVLPIPKKADAVSAFFAAPDWEAVYRMAVEHRVVKVVWNGIQQLLTTREITNNQLPSNDLIRKWIDTAEHREQRYEQQIEVVRRLGTFYAKHNIRLMLLNGYGVSRCYPTPSARECGDVDIWLYGDQKVADELLKNARKIRIEQDPAGQTLFRMDPVLVENHHRLPEAEWLGVGCDCKADIDGVEVRLPDANLGLIYMLRHMALKFRRGVIRMRHVADWALYIRCHHAEIDWTRIEEGARKWGMTRFMVALNTFAGECLGLERKYLPAERLSERDLWAFVREVIHPRFPWKLQKDALWLARVGFGMCRYWANRWKQRFVSDKKCRRV